MDPLVAMRQVGFLPNRGLAERRRRCA